MIVSSAYLHSSSFAVDPTKHVWLVWDTFIWLCDDTGECVTLLRNTGLRKCHKWLALQKKHPWRKDRKKKSTVLKKLQHRIHTSGADIDLWRSTKIIPQLPGSHIHWLDLCSMVKELFKCPFNLHLLQHQPSLRCSINMANIYCIYIYLNQKDHNWFLVIVKGLFSFVKGVCAYSSRRD